MDWTTLNCTTCRYELSQCLDGRLPSGRRAEVMDHAESCATCGTFWLELQAAQQLTLSLHQQEVGSGFREQLWQRIHAGEGTPSAVFQEDVPLWSKLRYAFTGAAAAAAVLIGVSYLHNYLHNAGNEVGTPTTSDVAKIENGSSAGNSGTGNSGTGNSGTGNSGNKLQIGGEVTQADLAANGGNINTAHGTLQPRHLSNQPSWVKPLSYEVVALETSRQFEDRYMKAERGMRNMHNPAFNHEAAIKDVLSSAHEMRDFGQLLLDLRDHQALFFTDAGVDADLRYAVKMLGHAAGLKSPDADTVQNFVAPVLSENRLGQISNAISLKPRNLHEERNHLMVLNTQRPDVFAKLFFIFGDLQGQDRLRAMRPGTAFLLPTDCDLRLVAPRSEVNANFMEIQIEWNSNDVEAAPQAIQNR